MRNGKRVASAPSLEDIRRHCKREFARLPAPLQRLDPGAVYPVEVAQVLRDLADEVDRRLLARRAK
jgi:nicotinate phosphoribosyltransferase